MKIRPYDVSACCNWRLRTVLEIISKLVPDSFDTCNMLKMLVTTIRTAMHKHSNDDSREERREDGERSRKIVDVDEWMALICIRTSGC